MLRIILFAQLLIGQLSKTGCVATALAQLMSVYKYPSSYNGYDFSWNDMTANVYAETCTQKAQTQIARLMQQLGLSENLNMNYGSDGSGADEMRIVPTLAAFGYSNPGQISNLNKGTVWEEVCSGHPCILLGHSFKIENTFLGFVTSVDLKKGHAWIVDGALCRYRDVKMYNAARDLIRETTETIQYFRCNFGQEPIRDGYYLASVFNTNNGPVYCDDGTPNPAHQTNSPSTDTEYYYRHRLRMVTGIRK